MLQGCHAAGSGPKQQCMPGLPRQLTAEPSSASCMRGWQPLTSQPDTIQDCKEGVSSTPQPTRRCRRAASGWHACRWHTCSTHFSRAKRRPPGPRPQRGSTSSTTAACGPALACRRMTQKRVMATGHNCTAVQTARSVSTRPYDLLHSEAMSSRATCPLHATHCGRLAQAMRWGKEHCSVQTQLRPP